MLYFVQKFQYPTDRENNSRIQPLLVSQFSVNPSNTQLIVWHIIYLERKIFTVNLIQSFTEIFNIHFTISTLNGQPIIFFNFNFKDFFCTHQLLTRKF